MRIVMVHPHDIHSSIEPWTRRIKALAREFVQRGHEVKLVYFPLASGRATADSEGTGYEEIPFERSPTPVIFLKNIRRLTRLASWADIIHFQKCHHYAAVPAVIAAYIKRKPLHYDWDDWEEMIWYESCGKKLHSRFIGFSFKFLERFLPVLSDTVSVASRSLRDLAIGFGVDTENIFPAPVGADLEEFTPHRDAGLVRKRYSIHGPLVLYVGQLHGAQYIDLFIKAADIVLKNFPQVMFMIVGEGFMEQSLKKLCVELTIDDKVIFTGSVPHQEIPQYMCAADVCVAPFRDTRVTRCKSPLKIVEYMGCGRAVVASNVGEVTRMLGGVGVLVKAGDVQGIADGIVRLLRDKSLRENLGRFARKRAEQRYHWGQTASSLLEAYEKNMGNGSEKAVKK